MVEVECCHVILKATAPDGMVLPNMARTATFGRLIKLSWRDTSATGRRIESILALLTHNRDEIKELKNRVPPDLQGAKQRGEESERMDN